jgi:hypothetical protein
VPSVDDASLKDEGSAKDPTADTSFAIKDSMSVAIAFPAVVAISDLIADASGELAEDPLICEGAVVPSPLQALASITTTARLITRTK